MRILNEIARTVADAYAVGAAFCAARLTQRRRQVFPHIRDAGDVRTAVGYTPILGAIPHMPPRRSSIGKAMATHLDPRGAAANAYREIADAVLRAPGEHRTILITSPSAGDGKSVCATNLAVVLAQAGRTVLLIDGNLRTPAQHVNFDLKETRGFIDALRSTAALRWALQPSGIDKLDVLVAGAVHEDPAPLLAMAECRALLVDLAMRYDHLVIDSPAVGAFKDAALLSRNCDTTVLVIRAQHTRRDAAAQAMNLLKAAGARVMGTVINAVRERRKVPARCEPSIAALDASVKPAPTPPVLSTLDRTGRARSRLQTV